jgi:MOSC domain-containing protein YiiM
VRCAAIDVGPDTGIRDQSIPHALMRSFGHANCGVYAEVVNAGEIAPGNKLRG